MSKYSGTKRFNERVENILVIFHLIDSFHIIACCFSLNSLNNWINYQKRREYSLDLFIFLLKSLGFNDSWYFHILSSNDFTNKIISQLANYLSWYSSLWINLLDFDSLVKYCLDWLLFHLERLPFTILLFDSLAFCRCCVVSFNQKVIKWWFTVIASELNTERHKFCLVNL